MNRARFVSLVLVLLLSACGDEEAGQDKRGEIPPGPVPPQRAAAAPLPEETCDEVTNLEVSFSATEPVPAPAFTVTHTVGFIAGMRYNGESTAKLVYVVLANYEPELTSYNLDPPKEEGQVAVLLTFKTDSKELPFKKQNEEYAKMRVPTGSYEPGWMKTEASYQVSYYIGGKPNGPAISGDATGTATLTHSSPRLVCGTIDFTSEHGTTIKGTFSVQIEKDMWAK